MKAFVIVSAAALAAAAPHAALAQADFLTAKKVACTPVQMVECDAQNQCKATPVTEKDKTEILVLDFAAKKGAIRVGSEAKPFGDVAGDKVEGGMRSFELGESGNMIKATLDKAGKLVLYVGGNQSRAEATCVAEG